MDKKRINQISIDINDDLKKTSVFLDKFVIAIESAIRANELFGKTMTNCFRGFSSSIGAFQDASNSFLQFAGNINVASENISQFQGQVGELKQNISELNGINRGVEYVELADSIISIYTNLKVLGFMTGVAYAAQSAYNGIITVGNRALYIYQMQILTARSAIVNTTGATKAMNIAIAGSPYLIAAAAVATLGVAIYKLVSGNSEAEKAHKRLNGTVTNMNKEVATEQVKLDALFEPLNRAKEGTEEWNRAKDKIVSQYGDYLGKMGIEIKDVDTARVAYGKLSQSILDTARSRAMEIATSGAAETYADKEVEGLSKIRKTLYSEAESVGEINYSEAGKAFGQIQAAIRGGKNIPTETEAILRKFKKKWTDLEGNVHGDSIAIYIYNQIKELRSARSAYENEIAEARALFGTINSVLSADIQCNMLGAKNNPGPGKIIEVKVSPGSISAMKEELSIFEKQLSNMLVGTASIDIQLKIDSLKKQIEGTEIWIEKEAFKKVHGGISIPIDFTPVGGNISGMAARLQNDAMVDIPGVKPTMLTQKEFKDMKLLEPELPNIEKPLSNMERWNKVMGEIKEKNANMIDGLGSIGTAMGSIGDLIGGAAGQWLDWGANCIQAIGAAIPQIMALCSAQGTQAAANTATAGTGAAAAMSSIPFVGPILAIAAVASVLGALASIPKFAAGGLAYGPTLGLFGEYAGAQNNPEVIAPLNRLRNMLQPAGSLGGEVEFIIDGRVLRGILNKVDKINQRTR